MEKKRSTFTAISSDLKTDKSQSKTSGTSISATQIKKEINQPLEILEEHSKLPKRNISKKHKGYCISTPSSSGTQFFAKERFQDTYKRITTDEYFGLTESMSGSSDTFHCIHGPQGKLYTEKGLLKRNLTKELDPIPLDSDWNDKCPPSYGWNLAKKLEFLVTDPAGINLKTRLDAHLRDFANLSSNGYRIDVLDSVCVMIDYLVEVKKPNHKEDLVKFLQNMEKPILLTASSDVLHHSNKICTFIGFIGYLLIRMESEDLFRLVSRAAMWHLSAPDSTRGHGTARLRHVLPGAGPVLYQTVTRMLSVADSFKFPTFLEIALLLACYNEDNCIEMMKENIIENIFYRFNPYFPERILPDYDITPLDPQDYNVKLGESSVHMNTTLSLLLVLVKTLREYYERNPAEAVLLPHPDSYSQRCFLWAYRYECRARDHQDERLALTIISEVLLNFFGEKLAVFGSILMPDIMSLSVLTELPLRTDWIGTVHFNTTPADVQFKKILIQSSVNCLKIFPYNKYLVESRYWLLGLMYMIDPGLCHLRTKWSSALFAELRKTAFQALVCALSLIPPRLSVEYGLTRRIMWYIEWYSESPFELPILYWCLRLLQVIVENRENTTSKCSLKDLFDTHGIIIIIHLCYTLLEQKTPPVEKGQAIIAVCLQLLTSALDLGRRVSCCVYPLIKWPQSINTLTRKMLDVIIYSLDKHFIISDRWLISLLNFIWEAVIWNNTYRPIFIANDGMYKLLDIITGTRAPVQCLALALICDVARAGDAVGQLVTWRASLSASHAHPNLVKRGTTTAGLLAAIFRDECNATGVCLNEYGIVQDINFPLMSSEVRAVVYHRYFAEGKSLRTPVSLVAGDLAGSRLSKVYALLHMLSDDLEYTVTLADEAYNMYKNINLTPDDEAILMLCSNYLTLKLSEVWLEVKIRCPDILPEDNNTLQEFLDISAGWAKEIKRQQENIIQRYKKKEHEEENTLYSFLARVRLNIALDALREVRCMARSSDRACMTNGLIHDAVLAHHRRSMSAKWLGAPVLRTFETMLDDQNFTGQYVKVHSIFPNSKPKLDRSVLS